MSRILKEKLYTPKLKVKYIGLSTPFFYNDADKKGQYSITLTGTPADLSDWMESMDSVHEELAEQMMKEEGKRLKRVDPFAPFIEEEDKEGEKTGNILVKFKHSAKGVSTKTGKEWTISPKVFDAKGQPIPEDIIPTIGWGSLVRVSFDARAYTMQGKLGITYDLRATQVINLVKYDNKGGSADFEGSQEEGFVVPVEGSEF